jgi:hypothetical protein
MKEEIKKLDRIQETPKAISKVVEEEIENA